ncbi:MAG: RNA 2'-phosphotransferase [Planctomycetota bacterium]|jgi:putative RNA 2'-phosphotransferase
MHPTSPSRSPIADSPERRSSRLSKFLALVLRHRASQFGLRIDEEGFVGVDDLLAVVVEQGMDWVDREGLEAVCGTHIRKRFEIKGERIRATYGHSFQTPIRYEVVDPPDQLFAGMPKVKTVAVRENGLEPDGRQYVHLTDDRDEAMEVGKRQGDDPDVVVVRAREAAAGGIAFHKPTDGLYLSGSIPPEYLEIASRFGRRGRKGKRRR